MDEMNGELGLDTSATGEVWGREEGGQMKRGEGTACLHSTQLLLGATMADLGIWAVVRFVNYYEVMCMGDWVIPCLPRVPDQPVPSPGVQDP